VVVVAVGDLTPGLFAPGLPTPGEVGFVVAPGLVVLVLGVPVPGFLVPEGGEVKVVVVFFPSFTSPGFGFTGDAGFPPGFVPVPGFLVVLTPGVPVFAVVPVPGLPGVAPGFPGCAPVRPGVLAVVFGLFVAPGPGFVAPGLPAGFLTGGFFGGTAWN